jgi:hypothetical protein
MIVTLKINGEKIQEVNVPITNSEYCLPKEELAGAFQDWVKNQFGMED